MNLQVWYLYESALPCVHSRYSSASGAADESHLTLESLSDGSSCRRLDFSPSDPSRWNFACQLPLSQQNRELIWYLRILWFFLRNHTLTWVSFAPCLTFPSLWQHRCLSVYPKHGRSRLNINRGTNVSLSFKSKSLRERRSNLLNDPEPSSLIILYRLAPWGLALFSYILPPRYWA